MGYPAASDLTVFLEKSGLTIPSGFLLGPLLAGAISWWERTTGYVPWLAGSSTTRRYDPPGPRPPSSFPTRLGGSNVLRLGMGFTSITAIRLNVTTDYAGDLQVVGEDYELEPYNSADRKEPYTKVRFYRNIWGMPRSVSITGIPGYWTTLDASANHADVWNALLAKAGEEFCGRVLQGVSNGNIRLRDDKVETGKSIELLQKLGGPWGDQAHATMLQYRYIG